MPNKKAQLTTKINKPSTKWEFYTTKSFMVLVGITIIILAIFIFRGWVRVTLIPKGLAPLYSSDLNGILVNQDTNLQHPLDSLGFKDSSRHETCNLQQALSIHTEINCTAELQAYTKLPTVSGEKGIESKAQNIQALLLKNHWHVGSNGITLTSLINGTYLGKDYSPDAYYEKVTGDNDCVFDTMIAYSNPQAPAIHSTFSCSRTSNILGAPNDEIYRSSKGTSAY